MSAQINLLDWKPRYPSAPGFKEHTTSRDAAKQIAASVREAHAEILKLLAERRQMNRKGLLDVIGLTADQIATEMGWTILYTRPRVSELRALSKIKPTGERRKNASGMGAKVWDIE